MFTGAACKRLALEALRAADRGDIDAAIALADKVRELAADRRGLARWVAVAAGAVGTSVQAAPEASGDQLSRALGHIELGLSVLPHVDPDFAVAWRLQLLASRISISAITGDQNQLSDDLASLDSAWDRMQSDPTYALALSIIKPAMTVILGMLATAGWGLLAQLRLVEARRVLLLTANWSAEQHDDKVELISTILLASIAMLAGDREAASSFADAALDTRDRGMKFRTPLPPSTFALLDAMLARVCAWDFMRGAAPARAREVLRTTRVRLTPGGREELLPAYLLVLSHELQLLLDLGEIAAAEAVADATDVRSLFKGVAGGIVAGPLIRLIEKDDRALAAALVRRLAIEYEWQVPPSLFVEHLGAMALLCADNRDDEIAIDCVQRSVGYLALLGSNQWLASGRSAAFAEHRRLRDQCLAALSRVRDHPAAGSLGQEVMEAWRERSLRELALSPAAPLSRGARQLIADLDTMLVAMTARDQELDEVARSAAEEQLDSIRGALKREVGVGYASVLTPRSLAPSVLSSPDDRILVSGCVAVDSQGASIVSVTSIPGHAPQLRTSRASEEVLTFLKIVRNGFDPVAMSRVALFEQQWQSARVSLSYALGIDLVEDAACDLPVELVLDDDLRSLPIAALGTSQSPVGIDRAVAYAISAQPSTAASPANSSSTVSVLVFAYESAPLEVPALRRLEARGVIQLTVVSSLVSLRSALEAQRFDVLVISAHGHGSGMEYRFRAQGADVLHVHDLLGVRVPPTVLAASCYSGAEGESDISGLLATLHAQGAREVLSSLWAIPAKESSEIVSYILERIPERESLATLLRGAQTRFCEGNRERQGIYWWAGLTATSL
ncbi:CHAT domain-containing protein [Microbacterium lacticum]|uniref:CHAT domain-containing protein n=1 Tax=Microbacterium lacticum TaxID=33885 RepID=UPI00242D481C|nr:CHAT domain-containing protein [Microbacterium lacticum]